MYVVERLLASFRVPSTHRPPVAPPTSGEKAARPPPPGLGSLLGLAAATAQAEGQICIADQFGIVYLLPDVAKDQKLIEKHGKAQSLDIAVTQVTLSGGSAMNDALLSCSIDIAATATDTRPDLPVPVEPPVPPEVEYVLAPYTATPVERALPWTQRMREHPLPPIALLPLALL